MQKKRVNKSLMYIVTIVVMAILMLGSIGIATWALLRTKLDIGGNISFNGTGNILAEISNGKINNEEKTGVMTGFTIGPDYDEANNPALSTWTGLNLEFDEEGTDIVINFTVTNKDTEKTLLVETTPTFTSDKATMTVSVGGKEKNKVLISPQGEKEYVITFHLLNTEEIVDATNFSVTLNMRNAKDSDLPQPTLDKLTFTATATGECSVKAKDKTIEGEVIIPSSVTLEGESTPRRVTNMEGAFNGCSKLTSITIPSSVTSISYQAFYQCTSLTEITIPSSVTSIGDTVFTDCGSLTEITIPSSVTSIGDFAFYNCTSLTSITIPSSVTSIGGDVFSRCSSLTEITIPFSVASIGRSPFADCSSLKTIDVESGNSNNISVDGVLFNKDKTKLIQCPAGKETNSYTIPSSVTSIGDSAFSGCSSLIEITIPSSVEEIEDSAFSGCSNLTKITIPSRVTSIGSYAFFGCSSLTSITIPSRVTSIRSYAFYNCTSLTSITIPSSVTSIGSSAFSGCSKLTEITFEKTSGTLEIKSGTFYGADTAIVNFSGATWTSGDLSYTDADNVKPSALQNKTWTITKNS